MDEKVALTWFSVRFVGWDKRNREKAPELFYRFFHPRFFREMNGKAGDSVFHVTVSGAQASKQTKLN